MDERSKESDDAYDQFLELVGNAWTGGKERLVEVIDEMYEKEMNLLEGVSNMSPSTSDKFSKEFNSRLRAHWAGDVTHDKISVRADFDPEEMKILVETDVRGQILREMLDLKEHATRQALIAAGWTPPEGEQ